MILPVSVFAMGESLAHAHEMLFGFALAVVAGNQLGVVSHGRVLLLLALWMLARTAFLAAPWSAVAATLNSVFAAALAWHVAPRLFGSAKRLRNQALPATITALCVAAISWQLIRPPVLATVMLFALLLLFMGGRIVASAVAGQLHRQGEVLDARVQPRIEGALIVLAAVAAFALFFPLNEIAAAAAAASGALAALRLARWRLWKLRGRADLLCLAAGYAWLALGLIAFGAALATGVLESAAVHVITVGALGTLTFNVMALSWLLKARRYPSGTLAIVSGTVLLAVATIARVTDWLVVAATCWSGAYVALLLLLGGALSRANRARS